MTPLMKLLDHMTLNKITPAPSGDNPEMTVWMTPLHKRMTDSRTGRNIKLFIVRLITNRPKVKIIIIIVVVVVDIIIIKILDIPAIR